MALVAPGNHTAILGKLVQPLLLDDKRRWTVEWEGGTSEPDNITLPEEWLLRVVPQ